MGTTTRRHLVWGAGGHARVVADLVRALGGEVAGFIDREPARPGSLPLPGAAPLDTAELRAMMQGLPSFPNGAEAITLGVGDNRARAWCLRVIAGLDAPALVHPSAVISPSVRLARASIVLPLAVVNANTEIGEAVIINTGAIVEHDCQLAEAVHVSPGAVLAGGVSVGPRSWVGAGAVVIQGRQVGADVVIGAGAVIIRDVPDGVTVVGNPGRILHNEQGGQRG